MIGRITEPVIRNSTTSVATTMIASASGRWSARLSLQVHELGGLAARQARRTAGRAPRTSRTSSWLSSSSAAAAREHVDQRTCRRPSRCGGVDLVDARRARRSSRGVGAQLGARGAAPATYDRVGRGRAGSPRSSASSTWRAARRLAAARSASTDGELDPEERQPQRDQHGRAGDRDPARAGASRTRDSRYQKPVCVGARLALAPRAAAARRQRVHPRARAAPARPAARSAPPRAAISDTIMPPSPIE